LAAQHSSYELFHNLATASICNVSLQYYPEIPDYVVNNVADELKNKHFFLKYLTITKYLI